MIVLWRVTERCNLACGFCAYDRELARSRRTAEPAAVRRFAAVLADYQRTTGDPVLVSWLGGEPLLWPPMFELSRELRHVHGLQVSATTNGTSLLRDQTVADVVANLTELTVSVDGLAPFHDAVRGWPGGWDRIRRGVQALDRQRHTRGVLRALRANIVLMRDNLGQFEALCEALAGWGIDEITFNALGGRDRPAFFADQGLRSREVTTLRELVPGLQARLTARGVRLCASERYLQRIEAGASGLAMPVSDCRPGERFLFVDETERVSPCSFTAGDHGLPLAQLHDVNDLLRLPSRYREARRARPAPACGDCPSTQVFAKFGGPSSGPSTGPSSSPRTPCTAPAPPSKC